MSRSIRHFLRGAVVVAVTAGALVAPRAALGAPPTEPCTQANRGQRVTTVSSAEVTPTVTHFMAINIAPGTTGERTETLTVMNQVTTTFGGSTEISSEAGLLFVKVSVKVGFTVQTSNSSTTTETTTMRWTFSQPGYYGLYKGTRAVQGRFVTYSCVLRSDTSTQGIWMVTQPINGIPYTTFANIEVGTVRCGDSAPPGSLRLAAHAQLGC